jgi:hypothetical protein
VQTHGGSISAAAGDGKIWARSQKISKISVSQRQDLSGKISVDQLPVSAPPRTVISRKVPLGPTPCRIRLQISEPLPQSDSNISPTSCQEASYIEASAEDEVIMSEEANSRCLVLFADSVIPVVLPVPRSEDEFEQGGARAGSKWNRRNEEIVDPGQHIGSTDVQGLEEFKGETPAESLQQPAFINPGPRPSQRESQVRDALVRYNVFSEGARTDGPDFTPADWEAELPLQDIPWSQLAWVCSLGRPLDFISTSHIQRVRQAFIHCLQAVIDSPNEKHLWKRVCLLPTILFIDIGKCRRADLDEKVKFILGNCRPFKVSDFPGRMEKKTQVGDNRNPTAGAESTLNQVIGSIEDLDKRRLAYFKKLMTKGEVSKAFRAIVSDAKVLPYSQDGLQFLQSKNPAATPGEAPWNWDEEYIGAEDPILITFEGVVKLIRSAPKGASCGVDNFPVDILKQLTKTVIKKEFPTDTRLFLDLLLGFLRRWRGHSTAEGCNQGSTDQKSHNISENRGRSSAIASSAGSADSVRGHPVLWGLRWNRAKPGAIRPRSPPLASRQGRQ